MNASKLIQGLSALIYLIGSFFYMLFSPLLLRYRAYLNPLFWKLSNCTAQMRFRLDSFLFQTRNQYRSFRNKISLSKGISIAVLPQVMFALIIITFLTFAETLIISNMEFYGTKIWSTGGVTRFIIWINSIDTNSQKSFSLCSSIAQIAGIFIGLYFTAISVVASTVYSRVSSKIRLLFLNEETGNIYIRTVSLLGSIALILAGEIYLGFKPSILCILLMLILSIFSMFGFIKLGIRILNFFDPRYLIDYLKRDLFIMLRAAVNGFGSKNPSFQHHYQKHAEDILETYRDIVLEACSKQTYKPQEYGSILIYPLNWLNFYATTKNQIPTESLWFKRTGEQQNWLLADVTLIGIALDTGTQLQPKPIPNVNWFEEQTQSMLVTIINKISSTEKARILIDYLQNSRLLFETLGYQLAFHDAVKILESLNSAVWDFILSQTIEPKSEPDKCNTESLINLLALADLCGLCFIHIILGASERCKHLNANKITQMTKGINWKNDVSVHKMNFPRDVIKQIEYIQKGLNFEFEVEGKHISPTWYCNQLIALELNNCIKNGIESLQSVLEREFVVRIENLVLQKKYLLAVQLIVRGIEAVNKCEHHLGIIKNSVDTFSELRRISDIPWHEIDWVMIQKNFGATREKIVIIYAKLLPNLAIEQIPGQPDFFGHCFTLIANECYNSMANGKVALFKQLFPFLFITMTTAQQQIKEKLKKHPLETIVSLMSEPLFDILELSGFAYIYGELSNPESKTIVDNIWNSYFEAMKEDDQRELFCKQIYALVDLRQSEFKLFQGDIKRTSWEQDLLRKLRDMGVVDDGEFFLSRRLPTKNHGSPLIRAISQRSFSINPINVFLVMYVSQRAETNGLELPQRTTDFLRSFEREMTRESENQGATE